MPAAHRADQTPRQPTRMATNQAIVTLEENVLQTVPAAEVRLKVMEQKGKAVANSNGITSLDKDKGRESAADRKELTQKTTTTPSK